jgi:uncharacterized protein (DUF927 family)
MAGLEVRLVSLPSDAGAGMGLFQELHDKPGPGALADHIRDAARRHYGTAGRAFLEHLVQDRAADPAGLCAAIKELRNAFLGQHVPDGADGQVRSVAGRFALIGAAGELAQDYGVLPWPQGEAMRAAGACFVAWLNARGNAGAGEDTQAVRQVRAFIEAHGEARFTLTGSGIAPPPESKTINRAGFRRKVSTEDGGRWEYLILPETWKTEVCRGLDAQRAALALDNAGFLIRDPGRHLTHRTRLPDLGLVRVYVVRGAILGGDHAE